MSGGGSEVVRGWFGVVLEIDGGLVDLPGDWCSATGVAWCVWFRLGWSMVRGLMVGMKHSYFTGITYKDREHKIVCE